MEGIAAIAIVVSKTFSWMSVLLLSELISDADAVNNGPVEIVSETSTELNLISLFTSLLSDFIVNLRT